MESFLKYLSDNGKMNRSRIISSCDKNVTFNPKGISCVIPLPWLIRYVGTKSNLCQNPGSRFQGRWLFTFHSGSQHVSSWCQLFPLRLSLHLCFPFGYKNILSSRGGLQKLVAGEFIVIWGGSPPKTELTLCLVTTRCQQLIWFQFFSKGKDNPWRMTAFGWHQLFLFQV